MPAAHQSGFIGTIHSLSLHMLLNRVSFHYLKRSSVFSSLAASIPVFSLLGYPAKMSYKLLNELNERSELWKIVVRVQRRWNLYDKSAPNELFCVTMVLVDEQVFEHFTFEFFICCC